jgi:ubiquinone biosynthesis protein
MLSIRNIGVIGRTYRHLNRYRQILTIVFKYGFGDIIDRMNIEQYAEVGLQLISRKQRRQVEKQTTAERARLMLQELGPAFIKLGQLLSTRSDLFPSELTEEFARLQDNVPPFSFAKARDIVETELGRPVSEIFEFFDDQPLASASIAQVHRAGLESGEKVAVKIQRPSIQKVIETDLEIMFHLATLTERHVEEMTFLRPVKLIEEFTRMIEKELDFAFEAVSMDRFGRLFMDDDTVCIPAVMHDISTNHVLTMELIEGIKISQVDQLNAAGLDCKTITRNGADFLMKQVFLHGFFHADPHPGNIFVLPNNVVCMVDYGMVGSLDQQTREHFVALLISTVRGESLQVSHLLLELTEWEDAPDLKSLNKDIADFMGFHLYKPLREIRIGKLLQDVLKITTRYRLRFPPEVFLMLKAFAVVEGVALHLDPDFDMVGYAAPFVKRVERERYSPRRIAEKICNFSIDSLQFLQQFPKELLEIARLIHHQKLRLKLEFHGLERMLATHDQISNRISFSIIIAALIMGSALILVSDTPPLFYGVSVLGVIGFVAAAIMGVWLVVAILKKGKL